MFGMELWFVYAIISAVTGGLLIFAGKIAAERNYDGVVVNLFSYALSAIILFILASIFSGFYGLTWFIVLIAAINAVTYMFTSVLRHSAMQCIDTAIFFPLYKTLSPILVIIGGVLLYSEKFSYIEWFGLGISLAVPLLLISHAENGRQKNLARGLRLLVVSAALAAIAAIALKSGVDVTENVILFTAIIHTGAVLMGILMLVFKKNGEKPMYRLRKNIKGEFVFLVSIMAVLQACSFLFIMLAFSEGTLSIVYTVQSLYILIPIILSIIIYKEHWNVRKIFAIVLSIAALALLK